MPNSCFALRVACAALVAATIAVSASLSDAAVVDYDIVYVRQPRYGSHTNTLWPEVFHPASRAGGAAWRNVGRYAACNG